MRDKVTAKLQANIRASADKRAAAFTLTDFSIAESDPNVARVMLAISSAQDPKFEDLASSFNARFNKEAILVEGSMAFVAQRNGRKYLTALAQRNVISMDYDENIAKMTCIAADTFADEDENGIWNAVGAGSDRRLVLQSSDDFSSILAARRKVLTMPEMASAADSIENGSYVMYYDSANAEMSFGFAIRSQAGLNIIDRKSGKSELIDPLLTVASVSEFDPTGDKEIRFTGREAVTAMDAGSIKKLIDYYRKIYKNTSFFVQLEKQIRGMRAA